MQVRKGIGVLGFGIASGAVLVIPAVAIANAASAAPQSFNSTASATAGYVSVAGTQGPLTRTSSVTATDANSPQNNAIGLSGVTNLPGGLGYLAPYGANIVATRAEASQAGTSSACSAVAAGDCASGGASQPLTLVLSLGQLLKQFGGSLPIGSLPGGLGNDSVVLGLTGPAAACTAGPAGGSGSDFKAADTMASGTVDIRNGNTSLIGGPRQISAGNVLSGLATGLLSTLLQSLPANTVQVAFTPGSTGGAGSGPQASAVAGQLAVSVGGRSVVALVGGKVSCGSNQAAPATTSQSSTPAVPPSSPGSGSLTGTGSSTSALGSSSTSSEVPLGKGIQSDEGRYVPASSDTPLWASLVGGGAALAGGAFLWRRRLSRS